MVQITSPPKTPFGTTIVNKIKTDTNSIDIRLAAIFNADLWPTVPLFILMSYGGHWSFSFYLPITTEKFNALHTEESTAAGFHIIFNMGIYGTFFNNLTKKLIIKTITSFCLQLTNKIWHCFREWERLCKKSAILLNTLFYCCSALMKINSWVWKDFIKPQKVSFQRSIYATSQVMLIKYRQTKKSRCMIICLNFDTCGHIILHIIRVL